MTTVLWRKTQIAIARHAPAVACGIWAIVLGVVSGSACVAIRVFFRGLQWIFVQHSGLLPEAAASLSPERRVLTPILGATCATAVIWCAGRWSRSGNRCDEYVHAVRCRNGQIKFVPTLWRTLSAAFSVATGAAVGREGSMIQFAAAVTSWIGKRSPSARIPLSRQVACGAAAAVAAVYHAPIAGIFFATEIVLGGWRWQEMPGLALASGSGWLVSRILLSGGPLFPVHERFLFSRETLLLVVPLSIFLGLAAPVYHFLLRSLRFTSHLPFPLVWAGCVVGLLSLVEPTIWGNGDMALLETLRPAAMSGSIGCLLALRLVATTFCVGVGTVGGVFTPTLFSGAALGLIGATVAHTSQPALFAVIGLSAFLSAVTHAPWMSAFMAAELTGEWRLLPIFLGASLLALTVARRLSSHSLYAIATPLPTDDSMQPHFSLGGGIRLSARNSQ